MMNTKVVKGVRVPLTQQEIDDRQAEIDNYVEPIPQSVTLLQAKLAIDELNLTVTISDFINTLPENQKAKAILKWKHSGVVRRNNSLVSQVLTGIGQTEQEIDDLFVLAATQD